MEFETFAERFERKYFCNIATISAVAAGVNAVGGLVGALSGGGGGGGMPSAPSTSPSNIASQSMPNQQDIKAAPVYDANSQMQSWTSIFSDFAQTAKPETMAIPAPIQTSPTQSPTTQAS